MDTRPALTIRTFFLCVLLFVSSAQPCLAKKKPPLHPINLNTANSEQLQEVPGIGPATADKILKMRKSYGPFKSVDDLRAIKGIGPKRLEKMRKYLTVGKPSAKSDFKTNAKSPPGSPNNSNGNSSEEP
jgi:comEA protein